MLSYFVFQFTEKEAKGNLAADVSKTEIHLISILGQGWLFRSFLLELWVGTSRLLWKIVYVVFVFRLAYTHYRFFTGKEAAAVSV